MSDYFDDNETGLSEHEPVIPTNYEVNIPTSSAFSLRGKKFADKRRNEEDFPRNRMRADRQTPLIRVAMPLDALDIKELAHSVSLSSTKSPKTANENGFLVSGFGQTEYSQFVKKAEHFLTIHIGKELVGFLLAYGSEGITEPGKEELNMHIKNDLCKNFVLLKQICVSPKAEHRRKGYASLLYRELYARILHYYEHEQSPRPIYTAIVQEPANPVSLAFHKKMGFYKVQDFIPDVDHRPRSICMCDNLERFLGINTTYETRSEANPFYDSRARMDPHCVGIGISMYSIAPPDEHGLFDANVRVVMKWRQPGIEELYPRVQDGSARTEINIQDHSGDRTMIRFPRYDLNKDEVEIEQNYAYIDMNDPHDVITWQQVLRGKFMGIVDNLSLFPADKQELRFAFRMWDNDPDDRCRYFRQLNYADNTPWQLGIKRKVKSLSFCFLAPQIEIEEFAVSRTSRYIVKVDVLRETTYYLRTVAFPMVLITSLSFASLYIDSFGDQVGFNSSLLLTTVAYLFITKDVTPATAEVTLLDVITYGALLLSWMLIMLHFISIEASESQKKLEAWIGLTLCTTTVGAQVCITIFLFVRYKYIMCKSEKLGESCA